MITADAKRLAKQLKALSNPNRLRLFAEIRAKGGATTADAALNQGPLAAPTKGMGGCLLQHVIDVLNVGAPTVSHHLKELVNAGLVETERVGKQLECRVPDGALDDLVAFFGGLPAPRA